MKETFTSQPKRPPIGRSCLEKKLATTGASTAVMGDFNGLPAAFSVQSH